MAGTWNGMEAYFRTCDATTPFLFLSERIPSTTALFVGRFQSPNFIFYFALRETDGRTKRKRKKNGSLRIASFRHRAGNCRPNQTIAKRNNERVVVVVSRYVSSLHDRPVLFFISQCVSFPISSRRTRRGCPAGASLFHLNRI